MPCRYYTDDEERQMAEKRAVDSENDAKRLVAQLDVVTRVACEMSHQLSKKTIAALSEEAQAWITEHRKIDEERKGFL